MCMCVRARKNRQDPETTHYITFPNNNYSHRSICRHNVFLTRFEIPSTKKSSLEMKPLCQFIESRLSSIQSKRHKSLFHLSLRIFFSISCIKSQLTTGELQILKVTTQRTDQKPHQTEEEKTTSNLQNMFTQLFPKEVAEGGRTGFVGLC